MMTIRVYYSFIITSLLFDSGGCPLDVRRMIHAEAYKALEAGEYH